MEGASLQAIDIASNILVEDIRKRNRKPTELPQQTVKNALTGDLDDIAQALQLTLVALQRRLNERITETRRTRNTLAAIHQLPVEIFGQVFHQVLRHCGPGARFVNLTNITMVASGWRAIALRLPSLWVVIDSSWPPSFIKAAMERSRKCPLSVKVNYPSPLINDTPGRLVEHMGRVRSLTVEAPLQSIEALTSTPAPALEVLELLRLSHSFAMHEGLVLDPFCGQAPRLQDVTLEVPVQWDSVILHGLKTLSIRYLGQHQPSLHRMFEVLAACPDLVELDLSYMSFSPETEHGKVAPPIIHLPRLTSLTVCDLRSADSTRLLSSLRVPLCNLLKIRILHQADSDMIIMDAFSHLALPIINILRSAPPPRLALQKALISFQSSHYIDIVVPEAPVGPLTAWIKTLLQVDNSQVRLALPEYLAVSDDVLLNFLGGLNIVQLRAESPILANLILDYLSRPITPGPPQTWAWPNLHWLCMEGGFDAEAMLGMVQSRYIDAQERGLGAQEQDGEVKLSPFSRLDMGACRSTTAVAFEAITAIVGSNVASWEQQEDSESETESD